MIVPELRLELSSDNGSDKKMIVPELRFELSHDNVRYKHFIVSELILELNMQRQRPRKKDDSTRAVTRNK